MPEFLNYPTNKYRLCIENPEYLGVKIKIIKSFNLIKQ